MTTPSVYPDKRSNSSEIRYSFAGRTFRETVPNDEVESRVSELKASHHILRPFTDVQLQQLAYALDKLSDHPGKVPSLPDVVDTFLGNFVESPTLPDAVLAYIDHCRFPGGQSADTIRNKVSHLNKLVDFLGSSVSPCQINTADLQILLDRISNAKTSNNHRATYLSFFNWCRNLSYLAPEQHAVERTFPRKVKPKDPEVFHPRDIGNLLKAARSERGHAQSPLLAFIALGAFGGLRRSEILRLTLSDIHNALLSGTIILGSDKTKTNRRRAVPVHPALRAWLGDAPPPSNFNKDLPLGQHLPNPNRTIRNLIKEHYLDIKWIRNGLRKTFVSSYCALNTPEATAVITGHSVQVLLSNYKALTSVDDARALFCLRP